MAMFSLLRRREAEACDRPDAEAALTAHRGRPAIAAAPTAGKAVRTVVRPLMKGEGVGLSDLRRSWQEIVGEKLAKATYPERLAGGVLTLKVPGALAPFVQHQQGLILDRCRLAGAKVTQVALLQGALPKIDASVRPLDRSLTREEEAAVAASLAAVPSGRLHDALLRLGKAVAKRA
jgi:hypothetical protein